MVRLAREAGVAIRVEWRNASRGHAHVVSELDRYLRDLKKQGGFPDFLVVATDANCKGFVERSRQISQKTSPVRVVMAVPDPHIERWLLLDGAAFKAVLGQGCQAPDQKCARDRYKGLLARAVKDAGEIVPGFGGIEFAEDIIENMDIARVCKNDASINKFVDEFRSALRNL